MADQRIPKGNGQRANPRRDKTMTRRPVKDDAHPHNESRPHTSGTLNDNPEMEAVSEKGLPISPEAIAAQFLRDATEQYNFESAASGSTRRASGDAAVEPIIAEETLETSGQAGVSLPESQALDPSASEAASEPDNDVDLSGETVVMSSLFDESLEEAEPGEGEEEDELEVTPRQASVRADRDREEQREAPTGTDAEQREEEKRSTRSRLSQRRSGSS